jgi:hypothetical protein
VPPHHRHISRLTCAPDGTQLANSYRPSGPSRNRWFEYVFLQLRDRTNLSYSRFAKDRQRPIRVRSTWLIGEAGIQGHHCCLPRTRFRGVTTSSRKGVYNGRNSRIPWLSDRSPLI